MQKILIPFDGSPAAKHAVQFVIDTFKGHAVQAIVLNVQEIPAFFDDFANAETIHETEGPLRKKGGDIAQEAAELLQQAAIPHQVDVQLGPVAETIAREAETLGCQSIAMGTRGRGKVVGLLLGSTATKVLHLVHLPVTLVR